MSKPIYHARSSARLFGGTPEDYLPIHDFMDISKGAVPVVPSCLSSSVTAGKWC